MFSSENVLYRHDNTYTHRIRFQKRHESGIHKPQGINNA